MTFTEALFVVVACLGTGQAEEICWQSAQPAEPQVAGVASAPAFTGASIDVVLTAESVLAWDVASGAVLYSKNPTSTRQVASLNKLLTALTIRNTLSPTQEIEIPDVVKKSQALGVHIRLPVGEHAQVQDLLAAGLIASANDAMTALAVAAAGSEEDFVKRANTYALSRGLVNTKVANATGLSGGEQYSTAIDVRQLLEFAWRDPLLRNYLAQPTGTLITREGTRRTYESTNQLLRSYVPILAAKTGYTYQAGENLALITTNAQGKRIGLVVLNSADRWQDAKVLREWVERNYTWLASERG